jgi:hypothetical protein
MTRTNALAYFASALAAIIMCLRRLLSGRVLGDKNEGVIFGVIPPPFVRGVLSYVEVLVKLLKLANHRILVPHPQHFIWAL